jgi:hypothetical protein
VDVPSVFRLVNTGIQILMSEIRIFGMQQFDSVSNGSGLGLKREPNRCNRLYHKKTRAVAHGPVNPKKPGILPSHLWLEISI